MLPASVTYVSEPHQCAHIGEAARFFCEGFIGKCLYFKNTLCILIIYVIYMMFGQKL